MSWAVVLPPLLNRTLLRSLEFRSHSKPTQRHVAVGTWRRHAKIPLEQPFTTSLGLQPTLRVVLPASESSTDPICGTPRPGSGWKGFPNGGATAVRRVACEEVCGRVQPWAVDVDKDWNRPSILRRSSRIPFKNEELQYMSHHGNRNWEM